MPVSIDPNSGFCFGVVKAIRKAEEELATGEPLYCLGDIVHNGQEVERLAALGLVTIDHDEFARLHDAKVLLRAHGEPPSTYETARRNRITLIDASCPVVLALYGKKGHAEVNGLVGQTGDRAIVIENEDDLDKLDYTHDISLFSQTTKSLDGFNRIVEAISSRITPGAKFEYYDTICRNVTKRIPNILKFARENDMVVFVSGRKSSNGKELYEHCRQVNPRTYFVTSPDDLDGLELDLTQRIGICGATSTPAWLMEAVAEKIKGINKKD